MNKRVDDDDPFVDGDEWESDLDKVIGDAYDEVMEANAEGDESAGLDQPFNPEDEIELSETVRMEEGRDLVDKHDIERDKERLGNRPNDPEDDAKPAAKADTSPPKTPDNPPEPEQKSEDNSEDSAPTFDATAFMADLSARGDELKGLGDTPQAQMQRLIELNSFAQKNPVEYLAWAASQMQGQDPQKVFADALKLVNGGSEDGGDDDDDPFMSDRERELLAENKRLKAAQSGQGPQFGPDAPRHRAAQDLHAFTQARDAQGNLLRPHFDRLRPEITAKAQAYVQANGGKAATIEDIGRFYDEAVNDAQAAFGGGSAAQPKNAPVNQNKKAAAGQKALRASKSIGGTGQGASHSSAPSADASLEAVIGHFFDQQQG